MKKTLLFALLAVLGMTQAGAQEYEYVPLVREGVKWVYYYVNFDITPDPNLAVGRVYFTLELKGDTTINGKTYKALHKYYGNAINEENDTVPIYLREQDKVVYGIVPDGKRYHDCPICPFDYSPKTYSGEEFILYDFNDILSFCQTNSSLYQLREWQYQDEGLRYEKPYKFSDMVAINGHLSKRYVFNLLSYCCFVEGIGFDGMMDGYMLSFGHDIYMNDPRFCLSHVIEDGKVIYQSGKERNNNTPYLPIAREGVKWVNERVSVQDGDTTCYYYTYKFKPIGDKFNCYYTSYDESNPCSDSIVALAKDWEYSFYPISNNMQKAMLEAGRNMLDLEPPFELYQFAEADISPFYLPNYYIDFQYDDILTRENFVEVEPLMIEDVPCSRYAYIDEQGDTAAYVVEGIGFDSRDMGDLLTPFTRKPDPNADYQEWCGLSHVVKDGQIIYKGMRYRDGAHDGINEVAADGRRLQDTNYYDLMGRPVGHDVPTTPGIYIHQGKKIVVR